MISVCSYPKDIPDFWYEICEIITIKDQYLSEDTDG